MLLLTSTSDLIQVVTGSAVTVDVHASWIDFTSSSQTPGRTSTAITTSTTTTVVASPAASTQRSVKRLMVRNKSVTTCLITVRHTDGATTVEMFQVTLLAGELLNFDEEGFRVFDAKGAVYSGN